MKRSGLMVVLALIIIGSTYNNAAAEIYYLGSEYLVCTEDGQAYLENSGTIFVFITKYTEKDMITVSGVSLFGSIFISCGVNNDVAAITFFLSKTGIRFNKVGYKGDEVYKAASAAIQAYDDTH